VIRKQRHFVSGITKRNNIFSRTNKNNYERIILCGVICLLHQFNLVYESFSCQKYAEYD
jgi:hypothetical protein